MVQVVWGRGDAEGLLIHQNRAPLYHDKLLIVTMCFSSLYYVMHQKSPNYQSLLR